MSDEKLKKERGALEAERNAFEEEKKVFERRLTAKPSAKNAVKAELRGGDPKTRSALEKQQRVAILLDANTMEFPVMDVTVNGVRCSVDRGVNTLVPEQVADMIAERMVAERKIVRQSERMTTKLKEGGL